jgi:hypothetical protein
MLKLDQYSESILFQCDRCQHVGELFTEVVVDEGYYHCWGCLSELWNKKNTGGEVNPKNYVIQQSSDR